MTTPKEDERKKTLRTMVAAAHPEEEALKKALELAATARTVAIDNADQAEAAKTVLGRIQSALRAAQKDRKAAKQPWLDGGRFVDDNFKPLISALEKAKNAVKSAMNAYLMQVRTAQREAERQAAEQAAESVSLRKAAGAESMSDEGHMTPRLRPQDINDVPEDPAFSMARTKVLVIYDPEAIPDEFRVIDRVALRKAVVTEGRVVPGARAEYSEQLRAPKGGA
jgi:hypothetical protein